MPDAPPPNAAQLCDQWISGLRMRHIGHEQAAAVCAKRGRVLGIPAILATTAAGTTVLANADESQAWVLVAAGSVALAAALLGAVQTFLDYPALAERHQKAAAAYGALRRQAEHARASGTRPESVMAGVQASWARLEQESPTLPQRHVSAALRRIARQHQRASSAGAGGASA